MKTGKGHIVYFIGIGGIGMSALARWLRHTGRQVAGYDRVHTPLTEQLSKEGIDIIYEESVEALPDKILEDNSIDIIYTPAIPEDHPQLQYFRTNGYRVQKRSEALGEIVRDHFTIAVAGTHGKTTTSTMIAHILYQAGNNCAAFLGGVSTNYRTNFLINGEFSNDTIIIAEADEFDRSFLRLDPNIAVITSMDADHLDIYGNQEELAAAYHAFAGKVLPGGSLMAHHTIINNFKGIRNVSISDYGLEKGDSFSSDIRISQGEFIFAYHDVSGAEFELNLQVPGYHNVENATAAAAVAMRIGIDMNAIRNALHSFKGVNRRFEYIIKSPDLVLIDDYAHHPTEIDALLRSAKALYPGRKITAIFQPHLYSRTRDFAGEFARSLSLADEIILLDIYPAREKPIAGVTSDLLLQRITHENKRLLTTPQLFDRLENESVDVAITLGAGDIDKLVGPIRAILEKKER